jgi:hypothetical protein
VRRPSQIVLNVLLYGLLGWWAVESTFLAPDLWFAAVVWLLIVVALLITFIPRLHADGVSPGEYPYED